MYRRAWRNGDVLVEVSIKFLRVVQGHAVGCGVNLT